MKSDAIDGAADWDASAPDVVADQRAAYEALRSRCPVARDVTGTWSLLRHEDVRRAALDHVTFSSATSRFRSVPNTMDGEEHLRFRKVIDRFLATDRMAALVPMFREVADQAVAALPRGVPVDAVHEYGSIVAVRAQSRWLGWSAALEPTLLGWITENQAASRSGSLARTREVAARFDAIVREEVRRRQHTVNADLGPRDVTAELMTATVEDPATCAGQRRLTEAEIVSVLRNWTAGDLGSIALGIGVVVHYLATHPELQQELRALHDDTQALNHAVDEILRIDDPFVQNRRITTREVEIGGRMLPRGASVLLNWTAANRDPATFGNPDAYRPTRNQPHNLVYGIGRHACPGRVLATHELREALAALLRATTHFELSPTDQPARERPPLGGFARVPVILP